MVIPVSKDILEPVITTNVQYVNSFEEFEKLELKLNQTELRFDNFKQCFYIKSRDKFGEYSPVLIFFYQNFAQKIQDFEKEEFIKKCKSVGLSDIDTKIAEKVFIENMDNEHLWDWLLRNDIKNVELDTIRTIKWRIKKKLYPELIKHPKQKT
jgi:hypothetical protein